MSERAPRSHEHGVKHEKNPYGERSISPEQLPMRETKKDEQEIQKLLQKAEKHAKSSETIESHHINQRTHTPHANIAQGPHSGNRQIKEIQRHLRGSERQFSKFIHNPSVELVSDVAGATVARPSVLLVGGICSFVSSIIVIVICRYYGYEYNYSIGLMSLGGGFVLGAVFELTARLLRR